MKRVIKVLEPTIIQAIAAGEVIQRPADVVKELLDNALDAGANEIVVNLKDAGLSLIEVIDNGQGISETYLKLALSPHATSKLSQLTDFESLTTHGFRGEALSSIVQVAKVTLASRTSDSDLGYVMQAQTDSFTGPQPYGMPPGTRVSVSNLFNNLPVRQEFLRRSKSQLRLITSLISEVALANPEIAFELNHNKKQLLRWPIHTPIQRSQAIFGNEAFSQMLPLSYKDKQIILSGFISQPSFWHKRAQKQYLSINHRPVRHTGIQRLIQRLTNQPQSNQLYPVYHLHLQLSPKLLDVNIHPQKQTVEIFDFNPVIQGISAAIEEILTQRPITYSSVAEGSSLAHDGSYEPIAKNFRRGLLKEYAKGANQKPRLTGEIQQIANLYLLAPTSDGLLLVDQHALHERLLYDELKALYQQRKGRLQKKKVAVNLAFDVDLNQQAMLEENWETIIGLGIDIEPFGSQSYKINSVPLLYDDHDILELIFEVLEQSETDTGLSVDTQTEKVLASMACRLAIKAGDFVQPQMRIELVDKLLNQAHVGTCPHGRPVSIKITLGELHKLFKRS